MITALLYSKGEHVGSFMVESPAPRLILLYDDEAMKEMRDVAIFGSRSADEIEPTEYRFRCMNNDEVASYDRCE